MRRTTRRFNVQLTPRATRAADRFSRSRSSFGGPLGRFPGFRAFVNVPPALQIGGFQGNSSYNLNVQSLNNDELYSWAPKLEQAIAELPEVQDVSDNMELKSPRVNLVIDRDKAAAVGLNATQIENALSDGFGQKWTSTIYGARTQYRVLLELDPQYQERADSLKKISFRTPAGGLVPLESVVNFKENVGPQTVNHYGQLPVGQHFLRPEARRVARRRRRSRPASGGPGAAARRSRRASRVRRRCSRRRSPISVCCSSSRSASSTSCSACCTRATFIRSRFSPVCRRRASARCSRCGCSAAN